MKNLLHPHNKKSRIVTNEDIPRVIQDAKELFRLCQTPNGMYKNAFAITHMQITDEDPLRFFVTREGSIIINPFILKKTGAKCECQIASQCAHTIQAKNNLEGCMSFPFAPKMIVKRWNKVTVALSFLSDNDTITNQKVMGFEGVNALMFQHEIEHFEGSAIYPIFQKAKEENVSKDILAT